MSHLLVHRWCLHHHRRLLLRHAHWLPHLLLLLTITWLEVHHAVSIPVSIKLSRSLRISRVQLLTHLVILVTIDSTRISEIIHGLRVHLVKRRKWLHVVSLTEAETAWVDVLVQLVLDRLRLLGHSPVLALEERHGVHLHWHLVALEKSCRSVALHVGFDKSPVFGAAFVRS